MENIQVTYLWDKENRLGYKNRMGDYNTRSIFSFLADTINVAQQILDLGGGSGRIAELLNKIGHEVHIVDENTEAVRIAHLRGLNVTHANILDYTSSKKYSCVTMIELNHSNTTPFDVFIKKGNQLLLPGGMIVFSYINTKSWKYRIKQIFKAGTQYNSMLNLKQVTQLLSECGFMIKEKSGYNWLPFKVNSNSFLVIPFSYLEKILHLKRLINFSPSVLICAIKTKDV